MDGATFMGNAGIPCVPRPISRHSVVTGITDRAYLPAYEKPYRPLPALLLTLALMCEARASDMPPFKIGDPMCNTGFTISQRFDERNSAGAIIKSVWVRKCTKGKIVYGGKV